MVSVQPSGLHAVIYSTYTPPPAPPSLQSCPVVLIIMLYLLFFREKTAIKMLTVAVMCPCLSHVKLHFYLDILM